MYACTCINMYMYMYMFMYMYMYLYFLQGHAFACRCACLFAGRGALSRACRRVHICWLIYRSSSFRAPSRANPGHPSRMPWEFHPGRIGQFTPGQQLLQVFVSASPCAVSAAFPAHHLEVPALHSRPLPFLRLPSLPLLCLPFSHLRAPGRVLNHELVF